MTLHGAADTNCNLRNSDKVLEKIYPLREIRCSTKLLRDAVGSPSLEIIHFCLVKSLEQPGLTPKSGAFSPGG